MEAKFKVDTGLKKYREHICGEWKGELKCNIEVFTCSECKFKTASIFNFCPNCGADMRGKIDD